MSEQIRNVYLWNCNYLKSQLTEFFQELDKNQIDIFALNEIKIDVQEKPLLMHENHNVVSKPRNSFGGGVAVFIKSSIEFEQIKDLEEFNCEIVGITTKLHGFDVFIFNYYNSMVLNIELLKHIDKTYQNYIICGDLNSKHMSFGCKSNNKNVIALLDFINDSHSIILNEGDHTFFRPYNQYKEILDLFICSSNLYNMINECKVLYELDLNSDHYPVCIKIKNIM